MFKTATLKFLFKHNQNKFKIIKKLIYVTALFVMSLTANAQCVEQATLVTTTCRTTCLTFKMELTGSLSTDKKLMEISGGTMYRKPTQDEILEFINNDKC